MNNNLCFLKHERSIRIIILLGFFMFGISIFACFPHAIAQGAISLSQYYNPTMGIKIQYPTDWQVTSSHDNSHITFEDKSNQTIIVSNYKYDLESQINYLASVSKVLGINATLISLNSNPSLKAEFIQ